MDQTREAMYIWYYTYSKTGIVKYKLAFAKGICHLALLELNSVLPQLLPFTTPWMEFSVENEALCTSEKLVEWSLDRYFQELISWSQSLYLLISRKALNPFMVTSVTSRKPFVKWVLDCIELPLHQNLRYWSFSTAFLEQFLRAIWG